MYIVYQNQVKNDTKLVDKFNGVANYRISVEVEKGLHISTLFLVF